MIYKYNTVSVMKDEILVIAPCKINLHLGIFDRRPDGFHNLESIFQSLDIGDIIRIASLKKRFVCELNMAGSVQTEHNIVYKTVDRFRSACGFDGGLRICIDKRIPMGAGLGGGSSDAAAVLKALNQTLAKPLPPDRLMEIAASLGSDVPFFLSAPTALVGGRGECIRALDYAAPYAVVLVNPGIHSDTGSAFGLMDKVRSEKGLNLSVPLGESGMEKGLFAEAGQWPFYNDFLSLFLRYGSTKEQRVYQEILEGLAVCGADFTGLSGSGSTCFGVFIDHKQAKDAEKSLSAVWEYVHLSFPLARKGNAVVQ